MHVPRAVGQSRPDGRVSLTTSEARLALETELESVLVETEESVRVAHLVLFQNWIAHESRRFPVVVLEDASQPLATLDRATSVGVGG